MKKERINKNDQEDFSGLVIEEKVLKLVKVKGGAVIDYNWADIPVGLISNNQIVDQKKFAQLVVSLRKEAQPRPDHSTFAVIGLPEDQIFIQTLELPKELTDSEISRTVEHRSDEFFPMSYEDIVLDWQVIGKTKNKKRILIIAAPGKLIKTIVSSVRLAGVEPLSIEPKSFSVHRLLNYILRRQSLILIDFESDSASLSIYQNGEIRFHTKIGSPLTEEKVVGAIVRTLHYFKDKHPDSKPISRVICSGDTGDKAFLDRIGSSFPGIQVEKITLPSLKTPKGFEERMTFFASAIALALNKINIFDKHKTINLLPTEVKNNHRVELAHHYLGLITRLASIGLIFLVSILAIYYYKLGFDSDQLSQVIRGKQNYQISQSLQDKEEIVKETNRKSNLLIALYQNRQNIPSIIARAVGKVPSSITLTNVTYDSGKITLSGIGSRDDILILRDRLEKEEDFANVVLPLSSLAKENQSDFQISFNVNLN